MNQSLKLAAVAALSLTSVFSVSASADNAVAQAKFEEGKALFAQRTADLATINQALSVLAAAEAEAQDKELKYDILVLACRALYFQGTHTEGKDNKKRIHDAGQKKCDAAEAVTQDYSESAYFAAINLARWGQANGIVSSLFQVPTLKKYLAAAKDPSRTTRDGKDAESVDGYGPYRTEGRMLQELPALFGGSHAESVKSLQYAVKNAPELAYNTVYLGDSLIKGGNAAAKAEGRKLLEDLLKKDVSAFDPSRPVETAEELQMARDVLAGKNIH